jgi:predicted PurR-regulated permease PerM
VKQVLPRADGGAPDSGGGWLTRPRASALVLAAATAIALFLCWRMAEPFLPGLAWALVLAIVGRPLHLAIRRRVHRADLAAGLTTAALVVCLALPLTVLGTLLSARVGDGLDGLLSEPVATRVEKALAQRPRLAAAAAWIREHGPEDGELGKSIAAKLPRIASGSLWAATHLLVTFFVLFYLLRDEAPGLRYLRSLLPLSEGEANRVFARVVDVVRATVLGTLGVALIQGTLGGLMFWWLGLPGALFWGALMVVLSVLPVMGAALVWLPAVGFLALEGSWDKALVLGLWGSVVVALIDNLLYPIFMGDRLRLHTVPVFVAVVGGLVLFGGAGLVLGPLVLAVAVALLEVWRERTRGGHAADEPQPPTSAR